MKDKTRKNHDKLIRIILGFLCIYLGYARNIWFYAIAILAFITAWKGQKWLYDMFRPKVKKR